jgi:hypothetical protein
MLDVFRKNEEFLKSKGFILTPSGDTQYSFRNDEFSLVLDEWGYLAIYHIPTRNSKSINIVTYILTDEDFIYTEIKVFETSHTPKNLQTVSIDFSFNEDKAGRIKNLVNVCELVVIHHIK